MPVFGTAANVRFNDKTTSRDAAAITTAHNIRPDISGTRRISASLLGTFNLTFGQTQTEAAPLNIAGLRINGADVVFNPADLVNATTPGPGAATIPTAAAGTSSSLQTPATALFDLANFLFEYPIQNLNPNAANALYFALGAVNQDPSSLLNLSSGAPSADTRFNSVISSLTPTAAPGDTLRIRGDNGVLTWETESGGINTVRRTENLTVTFSILAGAGATISNTAAQNAATGFVDLNVSACAPGTTVVVRARFSNGRQLQTQYNVVAKPSATLNLSDDFHEIATTGATDVILRTMAPGYHTRHFVRHTTGAEMRLTPTAPATIEGAATLDVETAGFVVYDAAAVNWKWFPTGSNAEPVLVVNSIADLPDPGTVTVGSLAAVTNDATATNRGLYTAIGAAAGAFATDWLQS